jgi:hypothetical protein
VLGASAVNDFAQAGFNWVCAKSNAAQARSAEAAGEAAEAEAWAARRRSGPRFAR